VIQHGRRARFLLEAPQPLGVGAERGGQHLDRHVAPEPRIARPIHFAHPTRADGGLDLVRAETCAGAQGHVGIRIVGGYRRDYRSVRARRKADVPRAPPIAAW